MGPKSNDKGRCKRKAERYLRQKRRSHGRGGADWRDAVTDQQTPRNANSTRKPEEAKNRWPVGPPEGAWPCPHLDLGLLASGIERE